MLVREVKSSLPRWLVIVSTRSSGLRLHLQVIKSSHIALHSLLLTSLRTLLGHVDKRLDVHCMGKEVLVYIERAAGAQRTPDHANLIRSQPQELQGSLPSRISTFSMAVSAEAFLCQKCAQSFAHRRYMSSPQHAQDRRSLPFYLKSLHGPGTCGVVPMASRPIPGEKHASGARTAGSAAT